MNIINPEIRVTLINTFNLPPQNLVFQPIKYRLLPDIQRFETKDVDGHLYEIYLLEENSEFNKYLNYTGSLAGFYNARYLFELIKHKKVKVPLGNYKCYLRQNLKSDPKKHFIAMLLQSPALSTVKKITLNIDEVFQVVDSLCELHFLNPDSSSINIINNDNYPLVQGFNSVFLKQQVNSYVEHILKSYPELFPDPQQTLDKAVQLYKSFISLDFAFTPSESEVKVLCHGNLNPECLRFDENGKLVQIRHWEQVHFGSPIEDLAFLLLTSLPHKQRHSSIMQVLRRYYYKMVELGGTRFSSLKLENLKTSFLAYFRYAVFFNLFTLWHQLHDSTLTQAQKTQLVQRWQSGLEDAVKVEKGNFVVDDTVYN